jgi:hypothetical protein
MLHPQTSLLNHMDDMTLATNIEIFIIYINNVTLLTQQIISCNQKPFKMPPFKSFRLQRPAQQTSKTDHHHHILNIRNVVTATIKSILARRPRNRQIQILSARSSKQRSPVECQEHTEPLSCHLFPSLKHDVVNRDREMQRYLTQHHIVTHCAISATVCSSKFLGNLMFSLQDDCLNK